MAYDRFLIAPINNGLQTDLKPFMIPEDSFAVLENAYVFRGRLRKRFGARPMNINLDPGVWQQHTRLRIAIPTAAGITDAGGNAAGFVPLGAGPGVAGLVGQMFSIGDQYYTVTTVAPGAQPMLATMGAATFDAALGAYTFAGAPPLTQIYYYPAYPVMGFCNYEQGRINDDQTVAFDTHYAYTYVAGAWGRLGTAAWTGTDSQFFWGTTWHGDTDNSNLLFVTNFNQPDQIKYWNGAAWTTINPRINAAANTLESARLLVVFKNRLIALNTIENVGGMQNYVNRARFSQNGSPIEVQAGFIVAWREDIPGRGGYIDCPCKQSIVTASLLKDRLIVYFESSTWELVYTGNEILPFRWQQINSELGAQSTFSQIPFDKVILGIGNVGIHACNGANVERIDDKIPDLVFQINAYDDGPLRVCGIRDYYTEMAYWSFPSNVAALNLAPKFPNNILVYNYRAGTWATNDDSITAFGYYQQQDALTWASEEKWEAVTDLWSTGEFGTHPRQIVCGNQEGFTFLVDSDNPRNSISLQITNIVAGVFTVIGHNCTVDDFLLIENSQGITNINDAIFRVLPIDANTFTLENCAPVGVYTGGGTATRVSRIDIITKQFNFYLKKGQNTSIPKVDFLVNNEPSYNDPTIVDPQITVECSPMYGNLELVEEAQANGCNLGTSILELSPYPAVLLENFASQFWHPVYFQAEGESVQFELYWTNEQMVQKSISLSDFQLNAIMIFAQATASRFE